MEIRYTSGKEYHAIHPDTPDVLIDTGYGVVGISVSQKTQVILISGQEKDTVVQFNGKAKV